MFNVFGVRQILSSRNIHDILLFFDDEYLYFVDMRIDYLKSKRHIYGFKDERLDNIDLQIRNTLRSLEDGANIEILAKENVQIKDPINKIPFDVNVFSLIGIFVYYIHSHFNTDGRTCKFFMNTEDDADYTENNPTGLSNADYRHLFPSNLLPDRLETKYSFYPVRYRPQIQQASEKKEHTDISKLD